MNYFAHGYQYVDRPYFLAGTAIPDWLSAADRKVRVRSKQAEPWTQDASDTMAELARGIMQHHQDDHWFHATARFCELSIEFSQEIRATVPNEDGIRSGFVGHILVELLLDAWLIERFPGRLEEYYQAVRQTDFQEIEAAVNAMAPRTTSRLAWMIEMFCRERFLADYVDDQLLFRRLNHVMYRVKLPNLPEEMIDLIAGARQVVYQSARDLLPEGS